jgi:diguanylate cyclase (GGDEF)-like protein
MEQPHADIFNRRDLVNEEQRLGILGELGLLDAPSDAEFDTLVRLAKQISGCSIAIISLVDRHKQRFLAKCGLEATETPREYAFCAHAIRSEATMIVSDARKDERFNNNPLVTGTPGIVFYAGVPLLARSEEPTIFGSAAIGTLCVIHDAPHGLTADQLAAVQDLARLAEMLVERLVLTRQALMLAEQHSNDLRTLGLRHRQFRQAERMANIGSWRLNLTDNKTEWSEQVYEIHGLPVGQYPSLNTALDFYPGDARTTIVEALDKAVKTGQPFEVQTDFITARGELRRVRSMGEVELESGQPVAVIGVFQDVTQQYALEERLRRLAHNDDLTGLPNRSRFNEFMDMELAKSARSGKPITLLLMDLDGFKAINDQHGHLAGDEMLREFARRLRASGLRNTFFARLGGDEFVAVITCPDTNLDLETHLRELLLTSRMSANEYESSIVVSASIGACRWSRDTKDRSDLLHRADEALYEAKRAGRGCAKIAGMQGIVDVSPQPGSQ